MTNTTEAALRDALEKVPTPGKSDARHELGNRRRLSAPPAQDQKGDDA